MEELQLLNMQTAVEYQEQSIARETLLKNKYGSVTLFAFDHGQEFPQHTSSSDALIQVIEGRAEVFVDDTWHALDPPAGIILPASTPHAVRGHGRFKIQLTIIKPG